MNPQEKPPENKPILRSNDDNLGQSQTPLTSPIIHNPDNVNPTTPKNVPKIAIVGLLLAIFLAPVGFITSIIAWRRIRKHSLGGKKLAIIGTILGALLSLPFLFIAWLFIALGGFQQITHGNQAQNDFNPIAAQILKIGGVKLCDNGDSGYGIDNTMPWYQVYYTVPSTSDLTSRVKSIASQQGYQLGVDTNFVNQLKGLPDQSGAFVEPYGGEQFNAKSDYLVGQSGNKSLKVTINRQTSVALYCGVKDYGKQQQPGNSSAIIDFSLTLPDRNQ
jgi:hypothetical protein